MNVQGKKNARKKGRNQELRAEHAEPELLKYDKGVGTLKKLLGIPKNSDINNEANNHALLNTYPRSKIGNFPKKMKKNCAELRRINIGSIFETLETAVEQHDHHGYNIRFN